MELVNGGSWHSDYRTEVVVEAPQKLGVAGKVNANATAVLHGKDAIVSFDLKPAGFQRATTVKELLPWSENLQYWDLTRTQIAWANFGERFFGR